MIWSRMKVSDVGVAEGPPERKKVSGVAVLKPSAKGTPKACSAASTSSQASALSQASASSGRDFSLEVPVLTNDKSLDESTELVVYRPAPKKRQGQPAPVKLSKIMRAK